MPFEQQAEAQLQGVLAEMEQQRRWHTGLNFKLVLLLALLGLLLMHAHGQPVQVPTVDLTGRLTVCNMCSSGKYKMGTVYAGAVFDSVQKVVEGTNSSVPFHRATSTYSDKAETATVFALGSCVPSLESRQCNSCLKYAAGLLWKTCGTTFGGRYLTRDCYVRYEAYPFEEPVAIRTGGRGEPCTLANPNPKRVPRPT